MGIGVKGRGEWMGLFNRQSLHHLLKCDCVTVLTAFTVQRSAIPYLHEGDRTVHLAAAVAHNATGDSVDEDRVGEGRLHRLDRDVLT